MKKYVYVLLETGSWDYEPSCSVEIFKDFNTALTRFEQKIIEAKTDMNNWIEKEDTDEDKVIDKDYASYEIFEAGDFTRLHDSITITREEVK